MGWVRILCFLHVPSGLTQDNNCKEEISWISKCSSIYHVRPFCEFCEFITCWSVFRKQLQRCPGATITKPHMLGGFKQAPGLWKFWRLERKQDASFTDHHSVLRPQSLREDPSCLFRLLSLAGSRLTSFPAFVVSWPSVCLSLSKFPSYKTLIIGLGIALIQYNLILTNNICKDPISK